MATYLTARNKTRREIEMVPFELELGDPVYWSTTACHCLSSMKCLSYTLFHQLRDSARMGTKKRGEELEVDEKIGYKVKQVKTQPFLGDAAW